MKNHRQNQPGSAREGAHSEAQRLDEHSVAQHTARGAGPLEQASTPVGVSWGNCSACPAGQAAPERGAPAPAVPCAASPARARATALLAEAREARRHPPIQEVPILAAAVHMEPTRRSSGSRSRAALGVALLAAGALLLLAPPGADALKCYATVLTTQGELQVVQSYQCDDAAAACGAYTRPCNNSTTTGCTTAQVVYAACAAFRAGLGGSSSARGSCSPPSGLASPRACAALAWGRDRIAWPAFSLACRCSAGPAQPSTAASTACRRARRWRRSRTSRSTSAAPRRTATRPVRPRFGAHGPTAPPLAAHDCAHGSLWPAQVARRASSRPRSRWCSRPLAWRSH